MMELSFDFKTDEADRAQLRDIEAQVRQKLNFPGAEQLKVRIKKAGDDLQLQLDGPDIHVAEARRRLGMA